MILGWQADLVYGELNLRHLMRAAMHANKRCKVGVGLSDPGVMVAQFPHQSALAVQNRVGDADHQAVRPTSRPDPRQLAKHIRLPPGLFCAIRITAVAVERDTPAWQWISN